MDAPDHPRTLQGTRSTRAASRNSWIRSGDITQKILSERLKELEEEGIVTKKVDATTFPVKSEYTLTKSGLELVDIIRGIKMWALKWKIDNIPCGKQDCSVCVL